MKTYFLLFWVCAMSALLHIPDHSRADEAHEIQFIEDFVLSQDRERVLETLIPGTDLSYFYNCLHLQNTEQFDTVTRLMNTWRQQHGETQMYQEIRNRQMLLTYSKSPKRTTDYLIDKIRPQLNHQREQLESKPKLATTLDPRLIDFDVIKKQLLRQSKGVDGFLDAALNQLDAGDLNASQRRQWLSRVRRPTHPQLVDMILADLKHTGSKGFGSLSIHNNLTLDQLNSLSDRQPQLRNQTTFVQSYLLKLQPNPDVDWQNDPKEHEAYLQRLWDFAQDLTPAHNSLKALVLYRWLDLDATQDRYNKQRFIQYLSLPRTTSYVEPRLMETDDARRYPADLTSTPQGLPFSRIGDDEQLVRRYLLHFFQRETDYRAYSAYIKDDYLKVAFAEAKITSGEGNPEKWYSMISPNEYQQIKDRVDIEFAITNPTIFQSNDPIQLDLLVKNIDKLIVKVYEVNTQNFYRDLGREVNTDIQLDGLVPNEEFTYEYDETPLVRKRRSFDFPQLDKPGVYVIDFIGNGKSSRTVIRKGQLTYLAQTVPHGHLFRVLDEQRKVLKDASLWMSGQNYESDEDGQILVPFSTKPGKQPIVLSHGNLASLQFFQHESEIYKLSVAMHFDRESLLDRKEAAILLRPELLLNGTPVSPVILENMAVTVTSTTIDGVNSSKQFNDVKLSESQDTPIAIAVPNRLSAIRVDVLGTITDHRNVTRTYAANHQVAINGIDSTDNIEDIHLAKIGSQFMVQLLGKTGEPRPYRALTLQLQHESFKSPISVQLATNENGFAQLGELEDIVAITARSPTGSNKVWHLHGDRRTSAASLHVKANESLKLPHMLAADQLKPQTVSLYELRGNSFSHDLTDLVDVQPNFLQIDKLPPGDYSLQVGQESTLLRVTAGDVEAGYTVGALRRLEMRKLSPLQITSLVTNDKQLEIQLANSSDFARVHVYATRFYPAFDPFETFRQIKEQEPVAIRAPMPRSLYMAGRKLGDELQYVLERGYAKKFPGNMLGRPSLLLNSWPINDTQTSTQTAEAGGDFDATDAPAASLALKTADRRQLRKGQESDFANLDFLARSSTLLANLKPDKNGVIAVPIDKLQAHQHIHVVAVDPLTTVYRSHTLPTLDTKHRDLRLLAGLDAKKHYTQQKETSLLAKGEQLELIDITTAKFDTYDSLRSVYDLYATVSSNANLAKFQFIVSWPTLSSEEKREKYSEFASHELHFFLYKKDPDFFAEIVRPFLENKHHKTFLDHWLLETDLSEYLRPWNFAQLNTVERLLLGDRLSGESESVRRLLADQLALIPIDTDQMDFDFDTAIAGRALDRSDKFGFESKKQSLMRGKNLMAAPGLGRGAARRFAISGKNVEALSEATMSADDAVESEAMDGLSRESVSFSKEAEPFFAGGTIAGQSLGMGGRGRRLYEQLDKTQEWAETNYYRLQIGAQVAELVEPGKFWLDYAKRAADKPFYSVNWPSANRNFSEMMFALSVLDLPFDAEEHTTEFTDQRMTLTANSPAIVFHQQIRETEAADKDSPILIKQNYFRANDRYEMVQGQRHDKFVTDEFLTHVVYGCQVVLTNPTSSSRQIEVLQQVPHMAIATSGGKATKTVKLNLDPYHTQTLDYFFYFPDAGNYDHFPAHVSQGEELLGHAIPTWLNVVEKLSRVDEASWDYVSQFASDTKVIEYLDVHSLLDIDLSKIAFRMANKAFFARTIKLLSDRHVYHQDLWAYSLKHNDPQAIATYLQHNDSFLSGCGLALSSELIAIDPVDRKTYQHLDYKPLVNARAHQLGARREILNDRFHNQYHQLLNVLKYRSKPTNEDRITLTYYLLLQDRIEEAIDMFAKTERSLLDSKLQYDYFAAYLDCFQEQPTKARKLVTQYVDHPVPKWQRAFASVKSMLDELDGEGVLVVDPKDRTQAQTVAQASRPTSISSSKARS